MSAIPPLDGVTAPLLARPFLEGADPSPLAAVLAHVPELLETALPFIGTVYGPTALAARLKEIVVLRTSVLNGCRYCTRVHRALANEAGLTPAEITDLCDGRPAASFEAPERAAIAFAEALCAAPGDALAIVQPHFRDHEIVELAVLAGTTIFLNRFCTAMGIV